MNVKDKAELIASRSAATQRDTFTENMFLLLCLEGNNLLMNLLTILSHWNRKFNISYELWQLIVLLMNAQIVHTMSLSAETIKNIGQGYLLIKARNWSMKQFD